MILRSARKKLAAAISAAIVVLLGAMSASAQPPPPRPVPDYFPQSWKEFTYESDNMRVRFPAEPKLTTKTQAISSGTETSRVYSHRSFIELNLSVYEYAPAVDFEKRRTSYTGSERAGWQRSVSLVRRLSKKPT